MTGAAVWDASATPSDASSNGDLRVQAVFEVLGTRIRVVTASVELLRSWLTVYGAFRVPPGPAEVTVTVTGAGGAEVPRAAEVTVTAGGQVHPWRGQQPLFPPLWAPPLDRWVYLKGTVVGRAGQAVVLSGPDDTTTLLAVAMVARGTWLLAERTVPLDPGDLLVAPFPQALRLRRRALELLSIDPAHTALVPFRTAGGAVEWQAEPEALLGARPARVAAEVAALVFLPAGVQAGARHAAPSLDPLRPGEALLRLVSCLGQVPRDFEAGMDALVRLCARVPAYTFQPGPPGPSAELLDGALLA